MNKIIRTIQWILRNSLFISIGVLVLFYLRWFRLTPLVLMDDPTYAFLGGMVLLFIYFVVALMAKLPEVDNAQRVIFYIVGIFSLAVNIVYLNMHIPWLETTTTCNGITYYISDGAPLFDEQWTYVQMSKWKGVLYESHFWGYAPGAGANEIRCDVDKKETLFLRTYAEPPTLTYIDGEHPQSFYKYTGAKLKGYLYFMSEDWYLPENCNREEAWKCDISVYRLYQCRSDYTNCHPLSLTYTNGDVDFLELKANKTTNEINLFQEYLGSDDKTLIFTYGENSRCYAEGCTINNK